MQEIQSASWLEMHSISRPSDPEPDDALPTRYWLRTDPPTLAWCTDYEKEWSLTVREAERELHTASTWKQCSLDSDRSVLTVEELLTHVLFAPFYAEDALQNDLEEKRPEARWQEDTVEHEGRTLIRWHRETTQDKFHVSETVWTEPNTHLIVGKERQETDPITKRIVSHETCSDYRYNEELPENVFEMPPGKPIVQEEDDKNCMPEVWDTLTIQERQALQALLHRSETAWQNAEFAAFAPLWDFNVTGYVPQETEWKERMQQQAQLGSRWQSQIESVNKQDFIAATIAVNAFTWQGRHRVLHIKAGLSVSWEDGTTWKGTTDYYVRRKGRGMRIVHWEAPWEEIKDARQRVPTA